MPRVTVVMATYNWATVLPFSIGSVLDQTFTDFELLVVGDGCTDESGEVVTAVGDPRVRWHNLPANTGHQAGPANEGIRRARGDVIAYLGHDDLWLPRHLETLLGAVDAGARFVHGSTLAVTPSAPPELWPEDGWRYRRGACISPTMVVHDRALVETVGGWRMPCETGVLYPDQELWRRMAPVAPPRWVPRLTSVRLEAAVRRGVYRARPQHEQAYWLRRIRGADDPEQALLAAAGERYVYQVEQPRRRSRSERLTRALRGRLRHSLAARRLAWRLHLLRPAEEQFRAVRRFKGIDE